MISISCSEMLTLSTSNKTAMDDKTVNIAYHHGNLRTALVDAGLAHLELAGETGKELNLRELARQVGVSATATYRHFANKEALLTAIAAEGFRRFTAAQTLAFLAEPDHRKAFFATGRAYVQFAQQQPALFKLMFSSFASKQQDPEISEVMEFAYYGLRKRVALVLDRADDDPIVATAVLQAWSMTHGLSHLVVDGLVEKLTDNLESTIDNVLRQTIISNSKFQGAERKEEIS